MDALPSIFLLLRLYKLSDLRCNSVPCASSVGSASTVRHRIRSLVKSESDLLVCILGVFLVSGGSFNGVIVAGVSSGLEVSGDAVPPQFPF